MEIRTREMALALGYKRYFTGKPCRNGHIDLRDTKTFTCRRCRQINHQKYQENKTREEITGFRKIKLKVDARDRQTLIEFSNALNLARTLTESLK